MINKSKWARLFDVKSGRRRIHTVRALVVIVAFLLLFVPLVVLRVNAPTAHAAAGSNVLNPGETLQVNQFLTSSNGQYKLWMQSDGNFVLYSGTRALWQAGIGGKGGVKAVMQGDGNLVVYNAAGQALWQSGTAGNAGAHLAVQDDSNLVIYSPNNIPLWFSGVNNQTLISGQTLYANQYLQSHSGQYKLIMQGDGNLVLYTGNQALWQSHTYNNPGAWAVMQSDGNLVIYNAAGQALWQSGTAGKTGAYLAVQDDGNLVVYTSSGAVWASGTASGGNKYPFGKTLPYNPFAAHYSNQCTYYAEERMYLQTGVYMDVTGNAYQWPAQASSNGWTVGTTPAVNSVVAFPVGSFGSSVGHVAWVIQVNGSSLLVQDYNWDYKGAVVTTHWLPIVPGTQFIYP